MGKKSDIAPKIQILANRMRCSKCNATSEEALFGVEEDVKFRASPIRPKNSKPMFRASCAKLIPGSGSRRLRINRSQSLEVSIILIRVCLRCGASRKTGVPNTCTLEYD